MAMANDSTSHDPPCSPSSAWRANASDSAVLPTALPRSSITQPYRSHAVAQASRRRESGTSSTPNTSRSTACSASAPQRPLVHGHDHGVRAILRRTPTAHAAHPEPQRIVQPDVLLQRLRIRRADHADRIARAHAGIRTTAPPAVALARPPRRSRRTSPTSWRPSVPEPSRARRASSHSPSTSGIDNLSTGPAQRLRHQGRIRAAHGGVLQPLHIHRPRRHIQRTGDHRIDLIRQRGHRHALRGRRHQLISVPGSQGPPTSSGMHRTAHHTHRPSLSPANSPITGIASVRGDEGAPHISA